VVSPPSWPSLHTHTHTHTHAGCRAEGATCTRVRLVPVYDHAVRDEDTIQVSGVVLRVAEEVQTVARPVVFNLWGGGQNTSTSCINTLQLICRPPDGLGDNNYTHKGSHSVVCVVFSLLITTMPPLLPTDWTAASSMLISGQLPNKHTSKQKIKSSWKRYAAVKVLRRSWHLWEREAELRGGGMFPVTPPCNTLCHHQGRHDSVYHTEASLWSVNAGRRAQGGNRVLVMLQHKNI